MMTILKWKLKFILTALILHCPITYNNISVQHQIQDRCIFCSITVPDCVITCAAMLHCTAVLRLHSA